MSELAAGFRAGTQMAQSALDAYNSAKASREEEEYRAELKKVNDERNLKALGIDTSGGIGINPTRGMTGGGATIPGVNPVPGIAQGGATIPGVNQVPEIGLGMPGEGQPFTGFTGGAAQLAETMDPNYGLSQKMALAEQYGMDKDYARYLGQKDRVAEIERAEQAERQRQYEAGLGRTYQLERDKVKDDLDARIQTRLENVSDAQVKSYEAQTQVNQNKLNQLTNERERTEAAEIANNTLVDIMSRSTGGVPDLGQVNTALEQNPFFQGKPRVLAAAKKAASDKYFGDLGINQTQQARIFSQATLPLREALAEVPVDEGGNVLEESALSKFQDVVSKFQGFDTDPTDTLIPRLVKNEDGTISLYEGAKETRNFASFNELKDVATDFLGQADGAMANTTLQYMDNITKQAKAKAARLESQAEREEAFMDFVKQNAALVSNEDQMKKWQGVFRVGASSPSWDEITPGPKKKGLSIEEAMNQMNQNEATSRKESSDLNYAVDATLEKYSEEEIRNLLESDVGLGEDSRAVLTKALDTIEAAQNKKVKSSLLRRLSDYY
jgi:hypothetical protein